MRGLAWALVPVVLFAGAAVGYFAKSAKTKTVTVVQIQTQAPPPPATKTLTAVIEGNNGVCLSAGGNNSDLSRHTWTLRRPSNGLSEGDVVAVDESAAMDRLGCNLTVTFSVSPNLGFFVVGDDSASSGAWGPFDSHQLARSGWRLLLDES